MSIVDANYRFVAAAQEANARIAQRQQSLSLFVTIALSLIAALVAPVITPTLRNSHYGSYSVSRYHRSA